MNNKQKKIISVVAVIMLVLVLGACGRSGNDLDSQIKETAEYLYNEVPAPSISSTGGDWVIKGIADSGIEVEEGYFDSYYDNVRAIVKAKKGILTEEHPTEYARVSIGLNAIGKDAGNVEGYNLIDNMDDYKMITNQGVNAAAYALIASNIQGQKLECEDKLIDFILKTMESGTFSSPEGDAYFVDYVAMALSGLSFYDSREDVKAFIDKTIQDLSEFQKEDGSFGNCESTSETICALAQNGVNLLEDERFSKDGKTPFDGLMLYADKSGGFLHERENQGVDTMATERALVALNAIKLSSEGKTLYTVK